MVSRVIALCLSLMICCMLSVNAAPMSAPAEWVYVMRDGDCATYLAMDTVTRDEAESGTILGGDVKKVYTRAGLVQVYYALKADRTQDAETIAQIKQIDHSIAHVSYCHTPSSLLWRLHRVTFYRADGEVIRTLDFDDIARQIDTEVEWQPVTEGMDEERAIFYRLSNG